MKSSYGNKVGDFERVGYKMYTDIDLIWLQ